MIPVINLPCIPLAVFIVIAVIFVLFLIFTTYRYDLRQENYMESVTVLASLVLAFIILYAIENFDEADTNVNIFVQKICYLNSVAEEVDPSLTPLLIEYVESFLCSRTSFALYKFQEKLSKKVKDPVQLDQIKSAVDDAVSAFDLRISGDYVINNWIWYLVIIISIIFSLIFGLNSQNSIIDGIFILALVWLPITIIYYLYLQKDSFIQGRIMCILRKLYSSAGKDCSDIKICCPKEKCCVKINQ